MKNIRVNITLVSPASNGKKLTLNVSLNCNLDVADENVSVVVSVDNANNVTVNVNRNQKSVTVNKNNEEDNINSLTLPTIDIGEGSKDRYRVSFFRVKWTPSRPKCGNRIRDQCCC